MKQEDAMKLKTKQKVIHRRYGVCFVREVLMAQGELFGVIIRPANQNGRDLLRQDCGCDIPDMLEDLPRNLSIEQPPVKPGEKPIDNETAWGKTDDEMLEKDSKNHFAQEDEGVFYPKEGEGVPE